MKSDDRRKTGDVDGMRVPAMIVVLPSSIRTYPEMIVTTMVVACAWWSGIR
jgi:hypothetical protein